MSKAKARDTKSYDNEIFYFAKAKHAVLQSGFKNATARKEGAVKIIDAESQDGGKVSLWVKLGWTKEPYAAIQFGLFPGPEGRDKSDDEFVSFVSARVEKMKERGITHALLYHPEAPSIALKVEDVANAYAQQMGRFPKKARNTKTPTMWFYDPRPSANQMLTAIVRQFAVPLNVLAKNSGVTFEEEESQSRMSEVETRIMQIAFRNRVGEHYGWRCAISGSSIREILEAAHLPEREWRKHNEAKDGILLRADLHKLLDAELAWIESGKFYLKETARKEYSAFHGQNIAPAQS